LISQAPRALSTISNATVGQPPITSPIWMMT
jgi:hypothetical protein